MLYMQSKSMKKKIIWTTLEVEYTISFVQKYKQKNSIERW